MYLRVRYVESCLGFISVAALLTLVGCAAAVPPGPNANIASVSKTCARELHGAYDLGAAGNAAITALYAVWTLGMSVGEYHFCKYTKMLHPIESSSIIDGIYHPTDRVFSIAVPEESVADSKVTTEAWDSQGTIPEMVLFQAHLPGSPAYFVSVYPRLSSQEAGSTPKQFASTIFSGTNTYQDARGIQMLPLYSGDLVLDGEPAIFEVYKQAPPTDSSSEDDREGIFLLYWVVKTKEHAARLTVAWHGACPKCDSGPELEIRNMDPGIESFVDSFHFNGAGTK